MGDEYDGDSDYDEWFYVEDTYLVADDLAEHAVNSPPPTTYADDDAIEEWDRFEYYCDLEYGSDGYDDENFGAPKDAETQQNGKQAAGKSKSNKKIWKKRRLQGGSSPPSRERTLSPLPPVVWRSQMEPKQDPKLLDANQTPVALLPNWRELVKDITWPNGMKSKAREPLIAPSVEEEEDDDISTRESLSPTAQEDEHNIQDIPTNSIDTEALMAVLQNRLSDVPGPLNGLLNGMDPSKLVEFALRMMNGEGTGDDIADELAEDVLDGAEEDTSTDLASWISGQKGKQVDSNNVKESVSRDGPGEPEIPRIANEDAAQHPSSQSRKRRKTPDEDELGSLAGSSKCRRIGEPNDAPTTAKRAMAGRRG